MTEKRFHKAYCCGDTGVIDKLENDIRMNIDAKHKERKGKLNISLKVTRKAVEEVVSLYNNNSDDTTTFKEAEIWIFIMSEY